MKNKKLPRQVAKRRRVNSTSAGQDPIFPHKEAEILDDTWFEALKHLNCSQWSKMCLVSRQVNRVVQRNLTHLPPPVFENAQLQWLNFKFCPRVIQVESSMARSLQLLFHPIVYFKEVTIFADHQKLRDVISNGEDRYIRCRSFNLKTSGDTPGKRPNITALSTTLKWLEQNVRSDSISFPEWVSYRVHETNKARAMLNNFIFGASQKCKVQKLVFTRCDHQVEFLNNLIEDFLALPVTQGTIPAVVIDNYPTEEEHRAHLGENLIGREVDSQGAEALYEIESGDKRVRISFCRHKDYYVDEYPYWTGYYPNWNAIHKANLKFYTI